MRTRCRQIRERPRLATSISDMTCLRLIHRKLWIDRNFHANRCTRSSLPMTKNARKRLLSTIVLTRQHRLATRTSALRNLPEGTRMPQRHQNRGNGRKLYLNRTRPGNLLECASSRAYRSGRTRERIFQMKSQA